MRQIRNSRKLSADDSFYGLKCLSAVRRASHPRRRGTNMTRKHADSAVAGGGCLISSAALRLVGGALHSPQVIAGNVGSTDDAHDLQLFAVVDNREF